MSEIIIKRCVVCEDKFKIFIGARRKIKRGFRPRRARTCFRRECVNKYRIIARKQYDQKPEVKARKNERSKQWRKEKRHTNLLND